MESSVRHTAIRVRKILKAFEMLNQFIRYLGITYKSVLFFTFIYILCLVYHLLYAIENPYKYIKIYQNL